MLKTSLAIDYPDTVEANVKEYVRPILLPYTSGALSALEYPKRSSFMTGGSSNSSLSDSNTARAAGTDALAVT